MKIHYTEEELQKIRESISHRTGWDFSRMNTISSPPWEYIEVVKRYVKSSDKVLDIGTGGGERFLQLSRSLSMGIGIDPDPEMIKIAEYNGRNVHNISFLVNDDGLEGLGTDFNVILSRHAPFNLQTVKEHLVKGGLFITQQVGNLNMLNIKEVLGLPIQQPPIDSIMISANGLHTIEVHDYDIKYVVKDIESLVFWLNSLDMLHADIDGSKVTKDVDVLNRILTGNVTEEGFVTNEQRYLAIAQKV